MALSATAVREVLAAEGFAPLPRRLDEERPVRIGPHAQAVANVGEFVLSPREFTTRTGGQRVYRQFFITDLGHDEPTILLTNHAGATAKNLITRYACLLYTSPSPRDRG